MPSCYIATVAYGNEDAHEVGVLREYRDNVLQNHVLGRAFIKLYYSGVGEKIANFVKEELPSAKPIIRKGLDLIVHNIEKSKN